MGAPVVGQDLTSVDDAMLIEQQEELERDKAVLLKQLKLIRDEVRAPQRPTAQTCYAQRAIDNVQYTTRKSQQSTCNAPRATRSVQHVLGEAPTAGHHAPLCDAGVRCCVESTMRSGIPCGAGFAGAIAVERLPDAARPVRTAFPFGHISP